MNTRKIKKHLTDKINTWVNEIDDKELLKPLKQDLVIAGGAIASLLRGERVKDYDVFFKTKKTLDLVVQYYRNGHGKSDVIADTNNAITLYNDIQIITKTHGNIEDVCSSFDFNHCCCAYDCLSNELFLPKKALLAILNNELEYNSNHSPVRSLMRTAKFVKRGWDISNKEILKLCVEINKLDLTDSEFVDDYENEKVVDLYENEDVDW